MNSNKEIKLVVFAILLSICKCHIQPTADQLSALQNRAVDKHNYYRNMHENTGSLALNSIINQVAQNYSYQLAFVINDPSQNALVHSNNPSFGENIFLLCQSDPITTEVLLSKRKFFKFVDLMKSVKKNF